MREPAAYRPPFVTETDEARWDDCAACSMLMLVAAWTLGEATDRPSGDVMPRETLRRLREHMRDHLPAERQRGGLTVADAIAMVAAEWPDLAPLRPYRGFWSEFWALLEDEDHAAALWGNPAEVAKPASPLRRWTANDDFGHVVYVGRAKGDRAWVMDPLGSGAYRGQWVSQAQLRQYAYLDEGHLRSCLMVRIGQQSAATRTVEAWATRLAAVKARHAEEVAALQDQLVPIDEAVASARDIALGEAVAAITALRD